MENYNWGGSQIGNEMANREDKTSIEYSERWVICGLEIFAIKWLIENPAQQTQWQKGVHASLWFFSGVCDFWTSVLVAACAAPVSAQGVQLSTKTIKAIMKVQNFIGCKSKWYQC